MSLSLGFLGLFFVHLSEDVLIHAICLLIHQNASRPKIFLVANVIVTPKNSILNRSFSAGDIAYADYWLKEEIQGFLPNTTIADGFHVYESLLNQFYDEMTPLTSQKAYMVGPGNHEANCQW